MSLSVPLQGSVDDIGLVFIFFFFREFVSACTRARACNLYTRTRTHARVHTHTQRYWGKESEDDDEKNLEAKSRVF